MTDELRFERVIDAPPDVVFETSYTPATCWLSIDAAVSASR